MKKYIDLEIVILRLSMEDILTESNSQMPGGDENELPFLPT